MPTKTKLKSKNTFPNGENILSYLERTDKWYLGGNNPLIWAPPFPVWLDSPGFWDKAHFYNREIEPVFTWTLLDDDGNEISLRAKDRCWNPSKLVTHFELCDDRNSGAQSIFVHETKCCLPDAILSSTVSINNSTGKKKRLHFFVWTVQPQYPSKKTTWIDDVAREGDSLVFTKYLLAQHPSAPTMPIRCCIHINQKVQSYSVNLSEGSVIQPHWKFTPFAEKIKQGTLNNEIHLSGVTNDGLVYMALHTVIVLNSGSKKEIEINFSVKESQREKRKQLTKIGTSPGEINKKTWDEYFSTVPMFTCSDEYITKYYWYRWYGLRLNTVPGEGENYRNPFVCEGIGYFRAPISYSAMCHIFENRWLHDPGLAQGSLLTFIDNQDKDGRYRGYIDYNFYRQETFGDCIVEPFYHANWGRAVLELFYIHPDKLFLQKAYKSLIRYITYFDKERDGEGSGLYDIDNHYETGQEYMHRYMAVDENADKDNWGEVFRLKGVDVTVYIYELKKALAEMAELLGDKKKIAKWKREAESIKESVRRNMWDDHEEMFFDVHPATGAKTIVKATTCFYPYMTDIVDESHLNGLKRHLLSEQEFWTQYPVASSSIDDKYYHSDAEWKGKRMNCPWNGRVWPMTNSHMVEVLAQSAIRFHDIHLREKAGELIQKFITMMFHDETASKPNCFEHYNPVTGQGSTYRGVDDYQHSWVNDLIMKYICGLRPTREGLIIDPFPIEDLVFNVDNIKIRGKKVRVERIGEELEVYVEGKKVGKTTVGSPKIFNNF